MKQAVKYSNKYVGIVDKSMRKAITLFVNKKWQKAYDLLHFNNKDKEDKNNSEANLFTAFAKLYCAAQLESKTAEQDAHILLTYTNFEFWAYLEEHNFPRYARRFSYHFLAYIETNKSNFEDALNYVDEALYISSPIDDLDDIPLYEQKINILLAMNNTESAYFSIQKLLNLDTDNETFKEIVVSNEYKKFKENNNLEDFKTGKKNETAKEALDRYTEFINLHFKNNPSEIETHSPHFFTKVTAEEISKTEERLQIELPPSYRKFLLENGLFKFGKWSDYESRLLYFPDINTLKHELETEWSESCKNTDRKIIDQSKNLITFSFGDEGLQLVWYYCFDTRSRNEKTREMSVYAFNQDDWDFDALPICEGNGFDTHITNLINEQIAYFLE